MDQKRIAAEGDFLTPLKVLYKIKETSHSNLGVISKYLIQLAQAYDAFANNLETLTHNLRKEINKRAPSSAGTFSYCHYLENYILKVAEANRGFANKLNFTVASPYVDLLETLNNVNNHSIEKMHKVLTGLDNSRVQMKKCSENFQKNSENVTRSQEGIEKLTREMKPFDQIQKAHEKLVKSKLEAEESEQIYQKQIESTNTYLNHLYYNYKSVFDVYTETEDKKYGFNKKTILNCIKCFDNYYTQESIRGAFPSLDQQIKELDGLNVKSVDYFQFLTGGQLNPILEAKPLEVFIPYEPKKKAEEVIIVRNEGEAGYTALYNTTSEADLCYALDFIDVFLPKELKKSRPSIWIRSVTNPNTSQVKINPFQRYSVQEDKRDFQIIPFPLQSKDEEKIWSILENQSNRKFFVESFAKQKGAHTNKFRLRLTNKAYDYLVNFFIKLTERLIHDKDYEVLGKLILVTPKYYTIKESQIVYFYDEFKKKAYWEEVGIWLNVIKVYFERAVQNDLSPNRNKKMNESTTEGTPLVRKVVHFGVQKAPTHVFEMQKPSDEKEKELLYNIVKEMGGFICRLTKDTDTANDLLIKITTQLDLKDKLREVIEHHREDFMKVLKERFVNYKQEKVERAQKKWGKYYHIYCSLDFLEPKDLVKLLELNQEIRQMFKKRVYRTIFYNFGDHLSTIQRSSIWSNLLEPNNLQIDLPVLLGKFAELAEKNPYKKFKEVIDLDVSRTFSNFEQKDKDAIQDILQAYAVHDNEVGYVQGMNYITGFLHIVFQDPTKSLACFSKVMEKHMKKQIYANLHGLKPYWSKLDKMLDFYRPKLFAHFQKENLEAGFYSASWFLTTFVSVFKYKESPILLEKIWDIFLLDGPDFVFKVSILILIEFEDVLTNMCFASILPYMGDFAKEELSISRNGLNNGQYKTANEQVKRRIRFITDFGKLSKNLTGFSRIFKDLSKGLDSIENQLGKI